MSQKQTVRSRKKRGELKPCDPNLLQIKGIVVDGILDETEEQIVVQAVAQEEDLQDCPGCESNNTGEMWGFRKREILDVERDGNGKRVKIVLWHHRFRCANAECKHTFSLQFDFLDGFRLHRTKRLGDKVRRLLRERMTTTEIAVATGLSRRTIQSIAREAARECPTPQEVFRLATVAEDAACVIQVDDAHPARGLTNTAILLNSRPWELLESYTKAAIEEFFFTLPNREKVKAYASDLAGGLLDSGRTYFPNADIIADQYHVIKQLLKSFDELLTPLKNQLVAECACAIHENPDLHPILAKKKGRKPSEPKLPKRIAEPKYAQIRILLRTRTEKLNAGQKSIVRRLISRFPVVRSGYFYVQLVIRVYHKDKSPEAVSNDLNRWETKLSEEARALLEPFLDLCRRHRDAVCAFWKVGWSTSESEAQNRVIKDINRRGCGLSHSERRRRWVNGQSASSRLHRKQSSSVGDETGPKKKKVYELHALPPPAPVPIIGPGGQGCLFGRP